MNIHGTDRDFALELYKSLSKYDSKLSVSKDLYLLTFLSSETIVDIRFKIGLKVEKDLEALANAYGKILLSHGMKLEDAKHNHASVRERRIIEKEIFRIFDDYILFIQIQSEVLKKEKDHRKRCKWAGFYMITSVFFFSPLDASFAFYAELPP